MPTAPNTFSSEQLRGQDPPQPDYKIEIPIDNVGFPIGLNSFDVKCDKNVRVRAYADKPAASSATIHIAPWGGTVLNSGGCTWLQVGKDDRDFQHSVFNTKEDHPWDQPKVETIREVLFDRPYAEPPKVVCWLNAIDMSFKFKCRIKTYTKDITTTGFTLYISTWDDSISYSAGMTWIAYPANCSNITSGTYNTLDIRPWNEPHARCQGDISFDRTFQKAPLVLTALNWLDIDGRASCVRVKTLNTNITAKGMTWHLDTWGDTTLYSAGASYLAIQDF
ncbi:hypothetical protein FRB95_005611 [Tulasnella sp. JGI-2019a]|nr:hypothetical protein FRB95_005611 [Tulasnella sp. JGI-2019a]